MPYSVVHIDALAAAPSTTVLVVGGRAGAALPPSPFEYWYTAQPAYDAGDYERAIAIASERLAHHLTGRRTRGQRPSESHHLGA